MKRRRLFIEHPLKGTFNLLYNYSRQHREKLFNYYRMSVASFDELRFANKYKDKIHNFATGYARKKYSC